MTIGRHDILKWAISGAAFIGAIVFVTGCQTSTYPPQAASPEPRPVSHAATPVVVLPAEVGAVNSYGELNGFNQTSAPTNGQTSTAFQRHTYAAEGKDTDVSVDPSGKWMVFSSTRHSERPDVYLQKVDGVSVVRLTDDPADDAFPVFSPDGKTIAFSSTRNGNWDIYTMDTDGKHVVQVTNGSSQDLHPSFSPDGTRLVYCALGSRSDNWEIWVANLSTGERRIIGYGLFPTWSPDKTVDRIAFQRARQRGTKVFSLWTLDLIDGEARRVTEVAATADAAIVSPSWSPDGQKIAFATIRVNGGNKEIWTVDVDGSNRQRLTDGVGSNLSPAWASDNRVYFVSDRGSAGSIWSVRAEQTTPATALVDPALLRQISQPIQGQAHAGISADAHGAEAAAPAVAAEPAPAAEAAHGAEPAEHAAAVEAKHEEHRPAAAPAAVTAADAHEVASH